MFYIHIQTIPKSRFEKVHWTYEDTATNLKSARSKVYHLLKDHPGKRISVFDADPTTFRLVGDILRHTRGWGFKSDGYYWTKGDAKSFKLKADGTIEKR